MTLVANKCDLEEQRVVTVQDGQRLAEEFGPSVGFVETSAKADIRVEEVTTTVLRLQTRTNHVHNNLSIPGFSKHRA